ncbi:unnamed protein product [Lampetra planeri]
MELLGTSRLRWCRWVEATSFVRVALVLGAAAVTLGDSHDGSCSRKEHPRTAHQDLAPWLHEFTFPAALNYSQLTIDPARAQLIVGARNYLFRLSLANLSLIQASEWDCDETTRRSCYSKGKSEEECQNYIRVLLVRGNRLLACGTNAFTPLCTNRTLGNLNRVWETLNGVARCPFDPQHSAATLLTARGELYAATAVDFAGRDPAIYRSLGGLPTLRTAQYNSRWLNEPSFVLAWEAGGFVYVAFREVAVEQECGRRVVSRVARVCANDLGGRFLLEDTWTTYMKARLECSGTLGSASPGSAAGAAPAQDVVDFPELQSAVFVPEAGLLYGVFTTAGSGPVASAVCVYNMSDVRETFNGPFKFQESPRTAWLPHPNPNPNFQCDTVPDGSTANLTVRSLVDAQRLLLMAEPVTPGGGRALLARHGSRFTRLAIDSSARGRGGVVHRLLFVATDEGTVQKVAAASGCVIDEMELPWPAARQRVRALHVSPGDRALYVGTDGAVLKLPLERCSAFRTESTCVGSRDPFCGWDLILRRCTTLRESSGSGSWLQDLSQCPVRNLTVDGALGPWSAWETCQHSDGGETGGGSCLCRRRACDTPVPQCAGRPCDGATVQVANCSRNGGWTPWSAWSVCTTTCSMGFQVRQRSCSNPSPRHGGRVCVGQNREERFCNEHTRCPVPATWSPWGPWERCSAPCGGGVRTRRRTCANANAANNGEACAGCDMEHQACHSDPCPEARKNTPWTPWLPVPAAENSTGQQQHQRGAAGRHEQRFRYMCRARLPDPDALDVARRKVEMRFCTAGTNECSMDGKGGGVPKGGPRQTGEASAAWAPWATWSPCSRECGRGFRSRNRLCVSAGGSSLNLQHQQQPPSCPGSPSEFQECNLHPCPVNGGWSCWAPWSTCSATCGGGHRQRGRVCNEPVPSHGGDICLGLHTEESLCNTQPCTAGWGEWSEWSECDTVGRRQRSRLCSVPFPDTERCNGNSTETSVCPQHPNAIDCIDRGGGGDLVSHGPSEFHMVHLVAAGVGSGLLGCVVSALLLAAVGRCRRPHAPQSLEHQPRPSRGGQRHSLPLNPSLSPTLGKVDKYDSIDAIKVLNKNYLINEEKTKCINSHVQTTTTKTFSNTLYTDVNKYEDY